MASLWSCLRDLAGAVGVRSRGLGEDLGDGRDVSATHPPKGPPGANPCSSITTNCAHSRPSPAFYAAAYSTACNLNDNLDS